MSKQASDKEEEKKITETGIQPADKADNSSDSNNTSPATDHPEIGGRKGPEPTRYGDWEKNGRCIDF